MARRREASASTGSPPAQPARAARLAIGAERQHVGGGGAQRGAYHRQAVGALADVEIAGDDHRHAVDPVRRDEGGERLGLALERRVGAFAADPGGAFRIEMEIDDRDPAAVGQRELGEHHPLVGKAVIAGAGIGREGRALHDADWIVGQDQQAAADQLAAALAGEEGALVLEPPILGLDRFGTCRAVGGAEGGVAIAGGGTDRPGVVRESLLEQHDARLAAGGAHRREAVADRGHRLGSAEANRPGQAFDIVGHHRQAGLGGMIGEGEGRPAARRAARRQQRQHGEDQEGKHPRPAGHLPPHDRLHRHLRHDVVVDPGPYPDGAAPVRAPYAAHRLRFFDAKIAVCVGFRVSSAS